MSKISYELSADAIENMDTDLAIIPLGSIEQHGPHLPVMTDWAIAQDFGQKVAKKLNAFLIPAIPVVTCREHMGKKGSVWVKPTTLYQYLYDIVVSLTDQGFKKIAFIQCHGGIFIMTPLVRELNATLNPDILVVNIDTVEYFSRLYDEGIVVSNTERHAGEVETSMMLHIAPETVDMSKAADFVPEAPRSALGYGSIFRYCPSGVWGEPTKASTEKGEKILESSVELAAKDIIARIEFMQTKGKFGYSYF